MFIFILDMYSQQYHFISIIFLQMFPSLTKYVKKNTTSKLLSDSELILAGAPFNLVRRY